MSLFDNQDPFNNDKFDVDGLLFDKEETNNNPFENNDVVFSPFGEVTSNDDSLEQTPFNQSLMEEPMKQTPIDFDYGTNIEDNYDEEHNQFKECFIHGYDKRSVDTYVEDLRNDMQRVQTQLNQEVKTITLEKTAVIEERNALRKQLLETTKAFDELKEEVKDFKEAPVQEDEDLVNKLKEYEEQIELRNSIIGEFDRKEAEYLEQIDALKATSSTTSNQDEDLLEQIHDLMNEKEELLRKLEHGNMDETLQQLNKTNKALQDAYNGSQEEMNDLYQKVKSLKEENQNYATRASKDKNMVLDLKQELEKLQAENVECHKEINELIEKQSDHNEDDLEMIASLKQTVQSLTKRFEEEPEDMSVYVVKAMEYHKQLDRALVDIARLQLENLTLTQENKRLKNESN